MANSLKTYSKDLKRKNRDKRKSKLEDLLNINNMNLSKNNSNSSLQTDEFSVRSITSSSSDSDISDEEGLCNSIEFKKQNELLDTINDFKLLENYKDSTKNLLPKKYSFSKQPQASAPPANRNIVY